MSSCAQGSHCKLNTGQDKQESTQQDTELSRFTIFRMISVKSVISQHLFYTSRSRGSDDSTVHACTNRDLYLTMICDDLHIACMK